jgi:ATP synthase protein I
LVPYHNPIPEKPGAEKSDRSGMSGMLGAWVQAEKMMQIALLLPCAAFIGWLAGYGLDRWLHQSWMRMAGILFGIIAGLVGAIRTEMGTGPIVPVGPHDGRNRTACLDYR